MEIHVNLLCDDCQEWSSAHSSIPGTETRVRCPHCGAAYLMTAYVSQEVRETEDEEA